MINILKKKKKQNNIKACAKTGLLVWSSILSFESLLINVLNCGGFEGVVPVCCYALSLAVWRSDCIYPVKSL